MTFVFRSQADQVQELGTTGILLRSATLRVQHSCYPWQLPAVEEFAPFLLYKKVIRTTSSSSHKDDDQPSEAPTNNRCSDNPAFVVDLLSARKSTVHTTEPANPIGHAGRVVQWFRVKVILLEYQDAQRHQSFGYTLCGVVMDMCPLGPQTCRVRVARNLHVIATSLPSDRRRLQLGTLVQLKTEMCRDAVVTLQVVSSTHAQDPQERVAAPEAVRSGFEVYCGFCKVQLFDVLGKNLCPKSVCAARDSGTVLHPATLPRREALRWNRYVPPHPVEQEHLFAEAGVPLSCGRVQLEWTNGLGNGSRKRRVR